jgi:hypothetical protein
MTIRAVLGLSWGSLYRCAQGARRPTGPRGDAGDQLSAEAFEAAKAAASIMAVKNVYYRATHLIGDETYATLPAIVPEARRQALRASGTKCKITAGEGAAIPTRWCRGACW